MNIILTLLGHPQVVDIKAGANCSLVILSNDKEVEVHCLVDKLGVVQPTGGNRIYTGSESSFDFCFNAYLKGGEDDEQIKNTQEGKD